MGLVLVSFWWTQHPFWTRVYLELFDLCAFNINLVWLRASNGSEHIFVTQERSQIVGGRCHPRPQFKAFFFSSYTNVIRLAPTCIWINSYFTQAMLRFLLKNEWFRSWKWYLNGFSFEYHKRVWSIILFVLLVKRPTTKFHYVNIHITFIFKLLRPTHNNKSGFHLNSATPDFKSWLCNCYPDLYPDARVLPK